MPGLDGIALAGRSRTRAPRLAILLVSGHPDLLARASGLGIAGLATLAKPFALDKVRAEVRRLVGA
jgi:DNA-binding response OmpR family regulator